jgi:hypothetical protein
MSHIAVESVEDGLHPNERVVTIRTADGILEELAVDHHSVVGETLRVGYPIAEEPGRLLIELPRETLRGSWRVWVPKPALR